MKDSSKELKGKWLELFEQCRKAKDDFAFSKIEGFEELYTKYLKAGILTKQSVNKNLSITEASKLADHAASHAVTEIRSTFKDRCSNEPIIKAIRASTVSQIPGSKQIQTKNGAKPMATRYMNVVIGIPTYTLSAAEVKYITSKFDSDLVDYDSKQWMLTIKTFELHLEEMEPTADELVQLDKVTRATVPMVIAYLHDKKSIDLEWKYFFEEIAKQVKERVTNVLQKLRSSRQSIDNEAIEELFKSEN